MLSRPVRCQEFVGRALELDHFVARRRDAGEQRGGAILLSGEAGIGKSRLIAEFKGASAASRARIVQGECREFAQSPLGPLAQILAQLGESTALLRDAHSQEAQLEALLATFARIVERRVTVLIIEDLHWGSPELVHILRLLVRASATQRALFVLSYRDNEIVPSHPLYIPIGKLARESAVSAISLTRFTHHETLRLLERALEPGIRVPNIVLTNVAVHSDGNPLYGEELLRHAVDASTRPDEPPRAGVPMTLQAIVRERIERCSLRERRALEIASLFGRDFAPAELLAVVPDEEVPTETELADLVVKQLLVRDDTTGRYAFRHALTRDVMYADISEAVARPMHRRIADALEAHTRPARSRHRIGASSLAKW